MIGPEGSVTLFTTTGEPGVCIEGTPDFIMDMIDRLRRDAAFLADLEAQLAMPDAPPNHRCEIRPIMPDDSSAHKEGDASA